MNDAVFLLVAIGAAIYYLFNIRSNVRLWKIIGGMSVAAIGLTLGTLGEDPYLLVTALMAIMIGTKEVLECAAELTGAAFR